MGERPESRWQADVTSLSRGVRKIYETKLFYDVIFTMRGQYEFKAHKVILAARSSEFQRLLMNPNVPEKIFIENESVTATGFEILLRYIYTDKIGTDVKSSIIDAWKAANCYEQKALLKESDKIIDSWIITEEEVWQLLDLGLSVPKLQAKCFDFIKNNLSEVISSPAFLNISFDCLNAILDSKILNDIPTLQRIKRVMEWASKRSEWADSEGKVCYSLVRDAFLRDNPPLLGKLGIETLDVLEMAELVKYKGLIAADELMGFTLHHHGDDSELPDWCKPVALEASI